MTGKLVFGAFIFLIGNSHAQEVKSQKNHIGFSLGANKVYVKDDNFSPLNQNGSGLSYTIDYHKCSKNIFGLTIQAGNGTFNSGSENQFETSYINANLELEYLKGFTAERETWMKGFIGLTYNTRILYLDWSDQEAYSLASTHGISVKALISKRLNSKHQITSSLAIPILSYIGRPPYNGINSFTIENQDSPSKIIFNGSLGSLNRYFGIVWDVRYEHKISTHLGWTCALQSIYQNFNLTSLFKQFSSSLSSGLTYTF